MTGQNSQSRPFGSMNRAVLQSGNPGVSASRNASDHCLVALLESGAVDGHVVGGPLAAAAVPRDEQVAVGALDDAGGVVVLGVQREDEFGGEPASSALPERGGAGSGWHTPPRFGARGASGGGLLLASGSRPGSRSPVPVRFVSASPRSLRAFSAYPSSFFTTSGLLAGHVRRLADVGRQVVQLRASPPSPAGTCPGCRPCPAAGPASCGRCAAASASTCRRGPPAIRPGRSSASTPRADTSPPARRATAAPMSLPSIVSLRQLGADQLRHGRQHVDGHGRLGLHGAGGDRPRPAGDERHADAALPHRPLPLAQRAGAAAVVAVAQPRAVVAGEHHQRVPLQAVLLRAPPGPRRPRRRSPGSRRRKAPASTNP